MKPEFELTEGRAVRFRAGGVNCKVTYPPPFFPFLFVPSINGLVFMFFPFSGGSVDGGIRSELSPRGMFAASHPRTISMAFATRDRKASFCQTTSTCLFFFKSPANYICDPIIKLHVHGQPSDESSSVNLTFAYTFGFAYIWSLSDPPTSPHLLEISPPSSQTTTVFSNSSQKHRP